MTNPDSETANAAEVVVPAEVFHPGLTLEEERVARGLTKRELATALGISVQYVSDLTRCRRGISADVALQLEMVWGISAQFWMNMQASWELGMERALREAWNERHPDEPVYVKPRSRP
ncbi:MAG: HigA family addiction module antidote protein [Patescibacteria group bacterium]|nr:HigA family addiction module antidote protein [Patescibacteria group bacterium]